MKEIWKGIKDYKFHEVSNLGRIRSLDKVLVIWNHTKKGFSKQHRKGKILINQKSNRGYNIITLCQNNTYKTFSIHRLVALAFIPNPLNKATVNHKDFNQQNNTVDNLEWCTQKENIQHAFDNGRIEKNKNGKKVAMLDKSGNFIRSFESNANAGRYLGNKEYHKKICECALGHQNTAYGYKWKYI
jgi:hypothetical protein